MYFTTARLHRALDHLVADCFTAAGLAPNQAFLLMTVQDKPGVTAGELAAGLHLSPSTLTRFLDKLESLALVRRTKAGRSAKVEATAEGARLRPVLEAGWAELYRRYTALLGEATARSLTASMAEAAGILEETGSNHG
jgi:DNA-binding MarR family transcriptional regulator